MRAKILLTATLAFTLAGCGAIGENTSLYSTNQPVVQRSNYALDVNVDGSGLSSFEQDRITQWFEAMKLGFGDRIAVDFGDGYADAATKQAPVEMQQSPQPYQESAAEAQLNELAGVTLASVTLDTLVK